MSTPDLTDALCALPCFRKVPREAVAGLAACCPIRAFDTAEVVLSQGAATDVAYLVVQGMLEVSVQTRRTRHHIATIAPGELVGESALFLRGVHRNATVMAHKPSYCLELTPSALKTLSGNPAMAALELSLIGALSRRIRKTNLEIQGAWKQTHGDQPADQASTKKGQRTFAGRLKNMFTGRGGDR
jgi:CRP-like cAMP-binding protein